MEKQRLECGSKKAGKKFWEIHRINNGRSLYRRWGYISGENIRVQIDDFDTVSEAETLEHYLLAKRIRGGYHYVAK